MLGGSNVLHVLERQNLLLLLYSCINCGPLAEGKKIKIQLRKPWQNTELYFVIREHLTWEDYLNYVRGHLYESTSCQTDLWCKYFESLPTSMHRGMSRHLLLYTFPSQLLKSRNYYTPLAHAFKFASVALIKYAWLWMVFESQLYSISQFLVPDVGLQLEWRPHHQGIAQLPSLAHHIHHRDAYAMPDPNTNFDHVLGHGLLDSLAPVHPHTTEGNRERWH